MNNQQGIVKRDESVDELIKVARLFAESGYFPDAKSIAQAFVKIQTGRELDIPPMAAMTGIAIISGKPVVGANIIASKIKTSGYNYRVIRLDNNGCEIEFFDRTGKPIGRSKFDQADAASAGLLNKENWKKWPRNMYFARAISNGQRWYCPDATSGGVVYTPDEMGAQVDENGEIIAIEQVDTFPPKPEPQIEPQEITAEPVKTEPIKNRRDEIDAWLSEMSINPETGERDEATYKRLLAECSLVPATKSKDGKEHWADNIAQIKGMTWTNMTHHAAKELYNAWKNKNNEAENADLF